MAFIYGAMVPPTRTSLKIAGTSGIASIIVALFANMLAIFYSSGFSYAQNWLSDLGGTSNAAFLNVLTPQSAHLPRSSSVDRA
ncbi:MAG: hypothetical protein ACXV44_08015 [Halobacteriota archaeon]